MVVKQEQELLVEVAVERAANNKIAGEVMRRVSDAVPPLEVPREATPAPSAEAGCSPTLPGSSGRSR